MKKGYLFLLLVFHLLILSRLQFTAWPEMVSFPYLINHGFVTYKDMVHAYPPLLVNILAILYKIFGYKLIVLKLFGWSSILVSDLLIFKIILKIVRKQNSALFGVLIYVILQPILEGNMVWPDLFIVPFLLLTFLLLIHKKYFWSGIAIGLAFLTKQTAMLYIVTSILYIVFTERNYKKLVTFIVGGLVIGVPFLLNLISQKSLVDFVNWTIIYPSKYWTKFPGYVQLSPTLREDLILLILFLLLSILLTKSFKQIKQKKELYLIFGFLICGIVGVYPRFSFFHFQSALAFFVIFIFYLCKKFNYWLVLVPVLILVISFRSLHFGEARFWASSDLKLGQVIQNETPAGKPIYLIGLDSSLYAFSDRLPNKPWLDNFGWYLEIRGVQQDVISGFMSNPPSVVFWQTPQDGNWYDIGVYQPKMITDYIVKNYVRTKEISEACHCVIEKGVWEWIKR